MRNGVEADREAASAGPAGGSRSKSPFPEPRTLAMSRGEDTDSDSDESNGNAETFRSTSLTLILSLQLWYAHLLHRLWFISTQGLVHQAWLGYVRDTQGHFRALMRYAGNRDHGKRSRRGTTTSRGQSTDPDLDEPGLRRSESPCMHLIRNCTWGCSPWTSPG